MLGMATALPDGNLIVPVIKNADHLNLVGLTKAVNDLATRARNNNLKPEEIQDGTYTFTNIGNFGSIMGTPIINQPQVGILAIGVIRKMPAVIETPKGDFIGIRRKVVLSHSYDHRIINGATGGLFVKRVAEYLENWDADPSLLTQNHMKLQLTKPLCFFDLETTGTDISKDRIVEIAILKLHPDGSKETLRSSCESRNAHSC